MKIKLFATASTLSILAATSAYSDENDAALLQDGDGNSALIVQDGDINQSSLVQMGDNNVADIAQTGDNNRASTVEAGDPLKKAMRQQGNANSIDINQTGNSNRVGNRGTGLDQLGDRGVVVIDQSSNVNAVAQVEQNGVIGAAATQNSLSVVQTGGNKNVIRNTLQTNTDVNDAANDITVTQTGRRNFLGERVGPATTGLSQNGAGNNMALNQTGDNNGSNADDQTTAPFGAAIARTTAVDQASASQAGNGNALTYDAVGNFNLFGSAQIGDDNTVDIDQQGDQNEAAASQIGDSNLTTIFQSPDDNAAVSNTQGSFNNSDIVQSGAANMAADNIIGSSNTLSTFQGGTGNTSSNDVSGDGNRVDVSQTALVGTNDSNVMIDGINGLGSNNAVIVSQRGINSLTVDIFGDRSDVNVNQVGRGSSSIFIAGELEGDDNTVSIDQANSGLFGVNNADVSINGDSNTVNAGQFLGANTLTVLIDGAAERASNLEGSGNSVTSSQSGFNTGSLSLVGDSNTVALDQSGFSSQNTATVAIDGAFNEGDNNNVDIIQSGFSIFGIGFNSAANVTIGGDRNNVDVNQSGRNTATLQIVGSRSGEGDRNTVNIDQTFNAGFRGNTANTITATIFGDDNNTGLSFTGDSATASGSLNPGDIFQSGRGNDIQLNVGDTLVESNGNAFAFRQTGRNNVIIGSINGGDANQVAVVQVGTANLTNFTQTGSFNVLGVTQ